MELACELNLPKTYCYFKKLIIPLQLESCRKKCVFLRQNKVENSMQSIDNKILANVKKCGRGKVYFVADFALYGEANSVQKALERLVK